MNVVILIIRFKGDFDMVIFEIKESFQLETLERDYTLRLNELKKLSIMPYTL